MSGTGHARASAASELRHGRRGSAAPARNTNSEGGLVGAFRGPPRALVLVGLPVPAPVAPLAILRLGARGLLLLGALASRSIAGTPGGTTASVAAGRSSAEATWSARRAKPWRSAGTSTGPRRSAEAARTRSSEAAGARRAAGTARRTEAAWGPAGAARTRSSEARAPDGTWSHRFGLRLLDDDGASLEHAPRELLDGRLRAIVRHRLDKSEATRASGVAVERDANAAQLDPFPGERLPQLLLVDVIRKIADEKPSTHR